MNFLAIVTILPQILGAISSLVKVAEFVFGGGTGGFKKDFVVNSLENIVSGLVTVSTGGQKETWTTVSNNWDDFSGTLEALIDFFADLSFPNKE